MIGDIQVSCPSLSRCASFHAGKKDFHAGKDFGIVFLEKDFTQARIFTHAKRISTQAKRNALRPMEVRLMRRSLMRLPLRAHPQVMSGRRIGKAGIGAAGAAQRGMQSSSSCRSSKQQRLRGKSTSVGLHRLLPG